eukprot:2099798-Lingulodinium_polyedra.AAC.1
MTSKPRKSGDFGERFTARCACRILRQSSPQPATPVGVQLIEAHEGLKNARHGPVLHGGRALRRDPRDPDPVLV